MPPEIFKPAIDHYFKNLQDVLANVDTNEIAKIADVLSDAYQKEKTILIMGNGGSAATASHMVCDINKGACFNSDKKFKMISLNDCMPMVMALGNDVGFDSVFLYQAKCYARPGDVVIGISGSGNSPNVLRAIEYAKSIGCTTIGVCGFDGGKLKPMVDHSFHVKVNDMQFVEDAHMVLVHVLMRVLMTAPTCGCCAAK